MRMAMCLGIICVLGAAAHAAVIGKATVTADQAPVMSGKQVVVTAKKGDTFDVTEVKGDWFGVAPTQGWVHKSNVRYEPGAPEPDQKAEVPAVTPPADGAVPLWAKVSQWQIDEARKAGVPTAKELDLSTPPH